MRRFIDFRNRKLRKGKMHFWFKANGKTFGYCYIRKNACSAFKNFICDTSQVSDPREHQGTRFDYMRKHHRIGNYAQVDACDHMILVYRDPYERLVSLYLNKVAQQKDADDILGALTQSGLDVEHLSLREFVTRYCAAPFRGKDPHIIPQAHHILPLDYDIVMQLDEIHPTMSRLIGHEAAQAYFSTPTNAVPKGLPSHAAADLPASCLRDMLRQFGTLPSPSGFFDRDLAEIVRTSYDADYRLIESIRAGTHMAKASARP